MGQIRPFDHAALDEVIHGRIRLGVVAYLSGVEQALFAELRDVVGTTDGNLSVHLRKLENAGYTNIEKRFSNRRPQTWVSLTPSGRKAFEAWLIQIEALTSNS